MTDTDLDEIGYADVSHRFARGDYYDATELKIVKKWLRTKENERKFLADCERASISAALVANRSARRANFIAFLALAISAISAREHVVAIFEEILRYLNH